MVVTQSSGQKLITDSELNGIIKDNLKGGTGLTKPQFIADMSEIIGQRADSIRRLINLGRTRNKEDAENTLRGFYGDMNMPGSAEKVKNGVNGSINDEIKWIADHVSNKVAD